MRPDSLKTLTTATSTLDRLAKELTDAQKKRLATVQANLVKSGEEISTLSKSLDETTAHAATLGSQLADRAREIDAAKVRIADLEAQSRRVVLLEKSVQDATEKSVRLAREVQARDDLLAATRAEAAAALLNEKAARKTAEDAETQIRTLRESHVTMGRQVADLTDLLAAARGQIKATNDAAPPRLSFNAIVDNFRQSVADLNVKAVAAANGDEIPVFVDDLQVELRAGLDVADGLHIVPLAGAQLTPESVSTVRFTLRPSPRIQIVEDDSTP